MLTAPDPTLHLVPATGPVQHLGGWDVQIHLGDGALASTIAEVVARRRTGPASTSSWSSVLVTDRLAPSWESDGGPRSTGPWPDQHHGTDQRHGTDRQASSSDTATVLVIGPTPFDARRALDLMVAVPFHGMITPDRPEGMNDVLDALDHQGVFVPVEVIERARTVPALTDLDLALAAELMAGRTNPQISATLGLSISGLKRRLTMLFELLEVDNRVQAAATAARLGVPPAVG